MRDTTSKKMNEKCVRVDDDSKEAAMVTVAPRPQKCSKKCDQRTHDGGINRKRMTM